MEPVAKVSRLEGVGKAVERFRRRLETDSKLRAQTRRCLSKMSIVET